MLQITTATVAMTALLFILFLGIGIVFDDPARETPNSVAGGYGAAGFMD